MRPAWLDRAACVGMDPEIFFPTCWRNSQKAIQICKRCPVALECLQAAVALEVGLPAADRHSVSGVRGGVDGTARLRIVLRQRMRLGIRNEYEDLSRERVETDDAA